MVPSLTQVPEEKSPPSPWAPWGAGKVPEEKAALAACPPSPIASTDNPFLAVDQGLLHLPLLLGAGQGQQQLPFAPAPHWVPPPTHHPAQPQGLENLLMHLLERCQRA